LLTTENNEIIYAVSSCPAPYFWQISINYVRSTCDTSF